MCHCGLERLYHIFCVAVLWIFHIVAVAKVLDQTLKDSQSPGSRSRMLNIVGHFIYISLILRSQYYCLQSQIEGTIWTGVIFGSIRSSRNTNVCSSIFAGSLDLDLFASYLQATLLGASQVFLRSFSTLSCRTLSILCNTD